MLTRPPDVYALDGIKRIGAITDYYSLDFGETDLNIGTWKLEIPTEGLIASKLLSALWPGIEVVGPNNSWRFGGFQIERERTIEQHESRAVLIGMDFMALMQDRFDAPNPSNIGRLWELSSEQGELTLATHLMAKRHFGANAEPARRIPDLSGVDRDIPGNGPIKYWVAQNRPLLEIWREWFTGQEYTCRLRLHREPTLGTTDSSLKFETPIRPKSPLRLSMETGGVESIKLREIAGTRTRSIQVGAWKDLNNLNNGRHTYSTGVSLGDWRTRYSEEIFDKEFLTLDQIQTEAEDRLNEILPSVTVSVEGLNIEGWGTRIDVGWLIDVVVPFFGTTTLFTLPVSGYRASWRPDVGFVRKINVGAPEPEGVSKVFTKLAEQQAQIRRLERKGPRG